MKKVAFFFSSLRGGGIERVRLHLANCFTANGVPVDLVIVNAEGPLLKDVPSEAHVIDLGASRTLSALPALVRYLKRGRPDVLLSAQTHNNLIAILARWLAGSQCTLVVGEHNDLVAVQNYAPLKDRMRPLLARLFYRFADQVLAVSEGVAESIADTAGIARDRIAVINNPVDIPRVEALARQPLDDEWLAPKTAPVVLGIGRLSPQKDFATLIRAVARVAQARDLRLLILGEGGERHALQALIDELGLASRVALRGYTENPYRFMAQADLFVMSSRWEGFPNTLVEALAAGVPVISTDCRSGPREILANGQFGGLVPVGDVEALADAITDALAGHPSTAPGKDRAREYSVEKICREYMNLLLGEN